MLRMLEYFISKGSKVNLNIRPSPNLCMYVRMYVCVYVCMYKCMYTIYARMHVCKYIQYVQA